MKASTVGTRGCAPTTSTQLRLARNRPRRTDRERSPVASISYKFVDPGFYSYSAARRRSSIHALTRDLAIQLFATDRTTLTSRSRVSAKVVNSARCSVQRRCQRDSPMSQKFCSRVSITHLKSQPAVRSDSCTRIWPENRYRVFG